MSEPIASRIETQVRRRRTFAIVSHPDAGKATPTEKLLTVSSATEIAGSVKARKALRSVASDRMGTVREAVAGCTVTLA